MLTFHQIKRGWPYDFERLLGSPAKVDGKKRFYSLEQIEAVERTPEYHRHIEATRLAALPLFQRLIESPMESLRFKDFRELKCGRDALSKLDWSDLKERQSNHDTYSIIEAFEADVRNQAACMRWLLRGLPLDKAIRKTKTDLEVGKNAIGVKRKKPTMDGATCKAIIYGN